MFNNIFIAAAALALGLAACGKKTPEPEKAPVPQVAAAEPGGAPHADAATLAGVSTGSVVGETLNAPGNYMRGMVGNVAKAKKAADLATKAAEARMNMDPEAGK